MGCPQCHSDEISPTGVCLICGYHSEAESAEPGQARSETVPEEEPGYSGMIEMDYSEGPQESSGKNEVPEWRQQLSQRLHEIKHKREAATASRQEFKSTPSAATQGNAAESLAALQAKLAQKTLARKSRMPSVPAPRQKTLQPLESPAPKPEPSPPPAPPSNPQEIRNLIDNAISRQVTQSGPPSGAYQPSPLELEAAIAREDKLILMSRTLSGLVDLIIVVLCTGAFIFAADYFSGIVSLDELSLILFFVVFLLNYFLYSVFFLFASNQTIGMMITDLRVVGTDDRRPSIGQILRRCCGYLVSFLGLGIGLIAGLFDRGSRCFHDRISGTHVVRI